jgi:RNA polymerase sigma-70 factor (ECF subfamily)
MEERDRRLIEGIAQGDETSFDQLMETYLPSVTAVALRLLKDEAAADDVAQETFLAVWRNAGSYRGEASPKSWVMRIALNKARSVWRWRSLRRWLSLDAAASQEEGAPALSDAIADPAASADPAAAHARADVTARLRAAVDALPARQKEMMLLRLEGLEVVEIAAAVGAAEGTVKATLHQARAKLEDSMEGDR